MESLGEGGWKSRVSEIMSEYNRYGPPKPIILCTPFQNVSSIPFVLLFTLDFLFLLASGMDCPFYFQYGFQQRLDLMWLDRPVGTYRLFALSFAKVRHVSA